MTTFELVMGYVGLGISVIPLMPRSKRPHFDLLKATGYWHEVDGQARATWEPAMKVIAPLDILKQWFANGAGVALVGGLVSRGLVDLEFDDPDNYRTWALDYKTEVNRTAVQRSFRGYHVLIRTPDAKSGHLYYQGKLLGEVRGEGNLFNCPPSIHPEGKPYQWLRKPSDGIIEVGSLAELGISRQATPRQNGRLASRGYYSSEKRIVWVKEALNRLAPWRSEDYLAWVEVGMTLANLGDTGLALWHNWSAQSGKYEPDDLDKKWKYFDPDGDLTLGSLFYWANQDDPGGGRQKGWQTL